MHQHSKLVAITGGSGFIGSHLIDTLIAKHYKIRVLARQPEKLSIASHSIQTIKGHLHDTEALQELVVDADYIIHCAGRVRGATAQEFIHDNVDGTRHILSACKRAKSLKKFVYISSLAAREPTISDYSNSKSMAEKLVKNANFIEKTIIRPPAVYGPNDRELLPLFNWMQKGILWIPGDPAQQFSLIHVYDLVELILHEMQSSSSGTIIEPDDGTKYNWSLVSQIGTDFFNRNIKKIVLPGALLYSAAKLNVVLSRFIHYSPMLTPSKIRELMHENWLSDGFRDTQEWSPQFDLKKGLSTLYCTK